MSPLLMGKIGQLSTIVKLWGVLKVNYEFYLISENFRPKTFGSPKTNFVRCTPKATEVPDAEHKSFCVCPYRADLTSMLDRTEAAGNLRDRSVLTLKTRSHLDISALILA